MVCNIKACFMNMNQKCANINTSVAQLCPVPVNEPYRLLLLVPGAIVGPNVIMHQSLTFKYKFCTSLGVLFKIKTICKVTAVYCREFCAQRVLQLAITR